MKDRSIAIIPARGGSKRIPRKNIKNFLGKPIIAYSIQVALDSNLFEDVIVSTDDEEIAKVAIKYGASVPFMRSKENANDFATLADVIEEVKKQLIENGKPYDYICCILPTAPLLKPEHLLEGKKLLLKTNADSVRPVARFSYPIQRAVKMTNGKTEMFYPEHLRTRSQDLEPAFHDAGQFYWMKFDASLESKDRYGFEVESKFVQDIDTLEDWEMAEFMYIALQKGHNR